jgi:hypothetical protein
MMFHVRHFFALWQMNSFANAFFANVFFFENS